MAAAVQFRLAMSSSYPTGSGSYAYSGSFEVVVQNLDHQKEVSIWAKVGRAWQDIPATYTESLPDNLELWTAPATNNAGEFAAKYVVQGVTYWDNNEGKNYQFPRAYDEFSALTGSSCPVLLGDADFTSSGLRVYAVVHDLADDKEVGIIYSTDNWASFKLAFGSYVWTMSSGLQVWCVEAPVSPAGEVKFALFYRVAGHEFWDNNFSRNYALGPMTARVAMPTGRMVNAPGPQWVSPEERAAATQRTQAKSTRGTRRTRPANGSGLN